MLKLLNLNSIRSRMVSGFIFLILLIFVLASVSLYMLDRTSRIAGIHGKVSQLEVFTLSLIKADNDFFTIESSNENYFSHRQSRYLDERDSLLARIKTGVELVVRKSENKSYSLADNFAAIDRSLREYNTTFRALEALYFRKGFKNYGLEGEMRIHAHKIEEPGSGIAVEKVLNLRRNEKDFFLRHDLQYAAAVNTLADKILRDLRAKKETSAVSGHLIGYRQLFNEAVDLQKKIGLTGSDGLRARLDAQTDSLTNQYFALAEYSYKISETAQQRARLFYLLMISGALVFAAFSAYWISKRLSEPIARLSTLMNLVTENESNRKIDFSLNNAAQEINTLATSFTKLMDRTSLQLREIKAKSKLLKKKNLDLKKVNAELDSFIYSTAHDLRSPLSSLLGLIDIAKHDNHQDVLVPHFAMMENSIHRLEIFIAQIVNYSQNKKLKITPEEIDLRALIDGVFENHRFVEGSSDIEKTITVQQTHPFVADRTRVTILFNNLISNAIRYYDAQKEQSSIHILVTIGENGCEIDFADNGKGIGPEHLDKIFNMFYRADETSKGSGLGLFIFKETVDKLKGTVRVEAGVGVGTRFIVFLPHRAYLVSKELIKQSNLN